MVPASCIAVVNQLLVRALDSLEPRRAARLRAARKASSCPPTASGWASSTVAARCGKCRSHGGPPVRLTTHGALSSLAAPRWTEDGSIVYAHAPAPVLSRIPASGGEPTRLTSVDRSKGEYQHLLARSPCLAAGRCCSRSVGGRGADPSSAIAAVDLPIADPPDRARAVGPRTARRARADTSCTAPGASLVAVPFRSGSSTRVTGNPCHLLPRVATSRAGSGVDVAVSPNGTLVYVPGAVERRRRADARLGGSRRVARSHRAVCPCRTYQMARLSPDGARAALDLRDAGQRHLDLGLRIEDH